MSLTTGKTLEEAETEVVASGPGCEKACRGDREEGGRRGWGGITRVERSTKVVLDSEARDSLGNRLIEKMGTIIVFLKYEENETSKK